MIANVICQELASFSEGATTNCEKEDDVDNSEDVLHVLFRREGACACIDMRPIH